MTTKTEWKKFFKTLPWKELIEEYAWYAERFQNLAGAIKSSIDGTFDGTRININTFYIDEKLSMAKEYEKGFGVLFDEFRSRIQNVPTELAQEILPLHKERKWKELSELNL